MILALSDRQYLPVMSNLAFDVPTFVLGIQDIFEFGARELKGPAAAERLLARFF